LRSTTFSKERVGNEKGFAALAAQIAKLLRNLSELKHQKRCCEFQKDGKRINLKESQRMISLDFTIPIGPPEGLHDRQQQLFRGREGQSAPRKL
jgi:hypothetical protein